MFLDALPSNVFCEEVIECIVEINPFFIYEDRIIAADCVLAQKI